MLGTLTTISSAPVITKKTSPPTVASLAIQRSNDIWTMNIILKHGNAHQKEVALKKIIAYSQTDEPCPRECPTIEIDSTESVSVLSESPSVTNDVPNIDGL